MAKVAAREFKKQGLDIRLGAKVSKTEVGKDGVKVTYTDDKGEQSIVVDKLLVSVGRRAATRGLLADGTGGSTHIRARWDEADGSAATADVTVALPPGHESLNVVIPWSDSRFQFTSKHQARPATGTVFVGDDTIDLDGGYGVLDVGRGRWPYRTRWNWGGGAGVADTGATVGLQLGGKWIGR